MAVRFERSGCKLELEVLDDCLAAGRYERASRSARTTFIARNRSELFAKAPLGAARLSASLETGETLRTEIEEVAAYATPTGALYSTDDLTGADCGRATHVVGEIHVGRVSASVSRKGEMLPARVDESTDPVPWRVALTPVGPIHCDESDRSPDAVPATPAPTAFTKLDAEIRAKQSASKYVYGGNVADVLGDGKGKTGAFALDVQEALDLARRLENEVVAPNESPDWTAVALLREAEVLERPRDGLARLTVHTGPGPAPAGTILLMTPRQQQLLTTMANAGNPNLSAQRQDLLSALADFWQQKRQQELDAADAFIVKAYARAVASVGTNHPAGIRAVRRLARYTRTLGNEKMAEHLGPTYVPNEYRVACAATSR